TLIPQHQVEIGLQLDVGGMLLDRSRAFVEEERVSLRRYRLQLAHHRIGNAVRLQGRKVGLCQNLPVNQFLGGPTPLLVGLRTESFRRGWNLAQAALDRPEHGFPSGGRHDASGSRVRALISSPSRLPISRMSRIS